MFILFLLLASFTAFPLQRSRSEPRTRTVPIVASSCFVDYWMSEFGLEIPMILSDDTEFQILHAYMVNRAKRLAYVTDKGDMQELVRTVERIKAELRDYFTRNGYLIDMFIDYNLRFITLGVNGTGLLDVIVRSQTQRMHEMDFLEI